MKGRAPGHLLAVLIACLLATTIIYMARTRRTLEGWATAPLAENTLAIVDAYERVLSRRPTSDELIATVKRFKQDPTFSLGVLENILMMGEERRRGVATQTNALRTELEGIATRGQVIMHVRNVYFDAVGSAPSDDTEKFLVDRFVQSKMDEHELMRLVRAVSIVPLAGNPYALGSPSDASTVVGNTVASA